MVTPNKEANECLAAVSIVRLLQGHRFDLSTEKHLQAGIELALQQAGFNFQREKRLSARDIPDFLVAGGVVVECKMKHKTRKVEVFKQIERYAAHQEVKSIIVASNFTMGLPESILGKPIYAASLSRGWI